jgi:hypothetical protein
MQGAADHVLHRPRFCVEPRSHGFTKGNTILKFILLAAALLIPASVAIAQNAAPVPLQAPAVPVARKPAPVRAAPAVPKSPDTMEISQIDGIRMVNPATYEIDGRTPAGTPVMIRMNAFVMQDLGRRLGTYGH